MRQYNEPVALRGTIQDLEQLRVTVANGAKRQTLQRPNVGMVLPKALCIGTILPRIARQRGAGNRTAPLACITRPCFGRAATEHVSSVAQKRIARALASHAKGIEQSVIANDHLDGLIRRQIIRKSGFANLGRVIGPLVTISDKVRQCHPFDDKSIRSAGLSGGDIDRDV